VTAPVPTRHPAVLIAPLVTFVAVVLMLVVAYFYDRLPAQLPECGFKNRTGIPCLACGGTRSMQALAHGEPRTALAFHPAFTLAVFATPLWLALGLRQYFRGVEMPSIAAQNRRLKIGVAGFAAVLIVNWIYLIFFLP